MTLFSLGWDVSFAQHFHHFSAAGLLPARVALAHKHAYELLTSDGPFTAECTGRLLHFSPTPADLPAVGDWVAIRPRAGERHADIHAVLPRRTKFSRRAAGPQAAEQVIATNIDTVFLVTALDQNYNLRRIERYLAVAWESGAEPVVVLNKADLHPDPSALQQEVARAAPGVAVVPLCALQDENLSSLAPWLPPGRSVALLGSSGVGKSTLVNRLLGTPRQLTSETSATHGKGRHTTTRRELVVAPSGVVLIDTPGMRELQLWATPDAAVDATFVDIARLIARCRFSDCSHRGEPGCAVNAALEAGSLAEERWQSFLKLQREQAYAARKHDAQLSRASKAEWKKINRQHRARLRLGDAEPD